MKNLFIPTKKNQYKPYLLRKACLVIYTLILLLINSYGGLIGINQVSASDITQTSIISLTNAERTAAGLNNLSSNTQLTQAAMAKAENMFEEQYWDHFGPNGETPWQFIIASGYNYVYAGENLAKGFRTAEGVVEAWMASPTHKENILSPNYKDIGIAVKEGMLLGKQTTLVVQMFGNLTTEVQGSNSQSDNQPVTKSPVLDTGQIKSISITQPKAGALLRDSQIDIKGFVEGDKDDYTVEIFNDGESLSEVEASTVEWQYISDDKYPEGEHSIYAQVKGTSVLSESINFVVDTIPPEIDRETVRVKNEKDVYTISFDTTEPWDKIIIINGEEQRDFLSSQVEDIQLSGFEPSEEVLIEVYDQAGNSTQLDISEYFIKGTSDNYSNFKLSTLINSIGTSDGINIVVVSFILILILVEIYILWKKGKLGKNISEIFVVGLWITILTIGIFKGFGGITI